MLSSWPVALILGCVLGALAGIGVGGDSLLMLWLTLVLDIPYSNARMLNLMFFLPCAVMATLLRHKDGAVPYRKIWLAILAGCVSAVIFSLVGDRVDIALIKKGFGLLLLVTGVRELLYKDKK